MLNMCQISSLMAAAEGPVAEFSSFANLEEKKRKSNLLMSFPKTGNQMGSFGQIRKNSFFRFCRPILDIFGLPLLSCRLEYGNGVFYPELDYDEESKSRIFSDLMNYSWKKNDYNTGTQLNVSNWESLFPLLYF